MEQQEINPQDTTRAKVFELWMNAPNPMVTFFKKIDVTNLVHISRKYKWKFNMLLCWCIGRAASEVKEFYMLPVDGKLYKYERLAVNTIVKNRNGEVSSCDIPYSRNLSEFNHKSLMMTAACTSIFTLIAMLCSNKAYSVAGCILLIFLLLFMGIRITSALNEPEYYSAYSYTENGVTVAEDEERNPNYLSGTKREVFEFLNEFLPGGQMLKLSTMKVDHLGRSAVYDGIIFVVTTGCGLLVFRRKDLK